MAEISNGMATFIVFGTAAIIGWAVYFLNKLANFVAKKEIDAHNRKFQVECNERSIKALWEAVQTLAQSPTVKQRGRPRR